MRILVTNDDGVDANGLHVLARAVRPFGDVVVVAPDGEYSGSGASVGPLHVLKPEVHRCRIEGIDEAWSVTGAPALCVMFARLGLFGDPFDLVVSGINPGANVGRSVYHSGTVGACLAGRLAGISGIAVSQASEQFGVLGQADEDELAKQHWDTAGQVAAAVVGAVVDQLPESPEVLNLNVPNVASLDDLRGWRRTEIGYLPPRSMGNARMRPKEGHEDAYRVEMSWGEPAEMPEHLDGGAVMAGWVSLSRVGHLETDREDSAALAVAEAALADLVG